MTAGKLSGDLVVCAFVGVSFGDSAVGDPFCYSFPFRTLPSYILASSTV